MKKLLFLVLVVIFGVSYVKHHLGVSPTSAPGAGKSGQLTIPPELERFMSPSLLTTSPAGTRGLSPDSRLALRQIVAQARANPAAFMAQLNAVAKASRGQQ
jgi:hypothetical protein